MLAVAYTRFSPRPNASDCVSCDVQLERIRAYCAMRDIELVAVVRDEAVSAAAQLKKREGGRQLFDLLKRHGAKVIVAMCLDRVFRDVRDCLATVDSLERKGIELHFADDGGNSINLSTAEGRFMLTIRASLAELERRRTAERTSRAMKRHQKAGRRMGNPKLVPYGKLATDDGKIVDNGQERQNIAVILDLHKRGENFSEICRSLKALGIEPRGARWHHTTIKSILQEAGAL